jgi:acyl-CoA oxidase
MLRTREYRLLKQVADHVSTHAVAGEDNLLLWNSQLMVTARAGEAHAQRLAMESAAAANATLQPGLARELANALAAVHALEYLNKHAAWYMSSGLLDSARYQSFETHLDALSDFLSVNTPLLIDAFGYGDATHAAIAASDAYPTAFASKLKWAIG